MRTDDDIVQEDLENRADTYEETAQILMDFTNGFTDSGAYPARTKIESQNAYDILSLYYDDVRQSTDIGGSSAEGGADYKVYFSNPNNKDEGEIEQEMVKESLKENGLENEQMSLESLMEKYHAFDTLTAIEHFSRLDEDYNEYGYEPVDLSDIFHTEKDRERFNDRLANWLDTISPSVIGTIRTVCNEYVTHGGNPLNMLWSIEDDVPQLPTIIAWCNDYATGDMDRSFTLYDYVLNVLNDLVNGNTGFSKPAVEGKKALRGGVSLEEEDNEWEETPYGWREMLYFPTLNGKKSKSGYLICDYTDGPDWMGGGFTVDFGGDEATFHTLEDAKRAADEQAEIDMAEAPAGFYDEPVEEGIGDEIKRYSDVVPENERGWWYFTTHGVGPGTIPKGVHVLDVKDGKNDRGTNGTYVLLDAVLNTSELDYYDMRELSPTDESLSRRSLRGEVNEDCYPWGCDDEGMVTRDDLNEFTADLEDYFPYVEIGRAYFEKGNMLEVDWSYKGYDETTKVKVDMRKVRFPKLLQKYIPMVAQMIEERATEIDSEIGESLTEADEWKPNPARKLANKVAQVLLDMWGDYYWQTLKVIQPTPGEHRPGEGSYSVFAVDKNDVWNILSCSGDGSIYHQWTDPKDGGKMQQKKYASFEDWLKENNYENMDESVNEDTNTGISYDIDYFKDSDGSVNWYFDRVDDDCYGSKSYAEQADNVVEVDPKGYVRLNGTEIGRIEPTEVTEDNYFDIWDNQLKDMIKENDHLLWDEDEEEDEYDGEESLTEADDSHTDSSSNSEYDDAEKSISKVYGTEGWKHILNDTANKTIKFMDKKTKNKYSVPVSDIDSALKDCKENGEKSKYFYGKPSEAKESVNEAAYTKDELWNKFGTTDLDLINAGNEEDVTLRDDDEVDESLTEAETYKSYINRQPEKRHSDEFIKELEKQRDRYAERGFTKLVKNFDKMIKLAKEPTKESLGECGTQMGDMGNFNVSEKKIDEANFWGYEYQYEVRCTSPQKENILLGGSRSLSGAENIALRQMDEIMNNPWESPEGKEQFLRSLRIIDARSNARRIVPDKVEKKKREMLSKLGGSNPDDSYEMPDWRL